MQEHLLETHPDRRSALVRFFAFNTLVSIVAYASEDDQDWERHLTRALTQAHEACIRYEELFSRTIPTSDVGRLNAAQGAWIPVNPDTHQLLDAARLFCEASGGIFDVTIGAATTLWDFHEGVIPDESTLAEAMTHVDWRTIQLRREGEGSDLRTFARLADPAAMVDLGGIAKGWIADHVVEQLEESPAVGAIVDLGGNVAVCGAKPDGSPWRVALRNPQAMEDAPYLEVLDLRFGSVVTSGTTERFFAKDGRRYHHILDARTGYPRPVPWAAASVVAEDSLTAEGFSTTMLALDVTEARALMAVYPQIREVIFVDAGGEVLHLPAP